MITVEQMNKTFHNLQSRTAHIGRDAFSLVVEIGIVNVPYKYMKIYNIVKDLTIAHLKLILDNY